MKKIIAASVLCTSLLGASFSVTQAANECPTPVIVKPITQSGGITPFNLQKLVDQYLKQCQQAGVKPSFEQLKQQCLKAGIQPNFQQVQKPAVGQQTQPAAKPAQTNAPTQAQAPVDSKSATQGLTADEKQMLDLVNQERAKQGLAPLKINMELQKLARMKSKDMIDKNYFSHQSPTYGSPFDMMNKYGVQYRTAGENIAGNSSVQGAHKSLMNSDGHRKNILNPAFTEVGIGIVDGGPYGKMFTQMFKG
ncbi:CAP domain-containing protein [Aneurinibacillus danicus]|uniref:SCP domain-containing protein n=1 Tax=Aneurinibacillus danicus TaxID=267746 RepID=A0A511VC96_9BACL|nr:CAP domain-containing protein [Aneurinibacillus danicus]GEN34862.1 hypothetical protein ADA01nite_23220 [Aneurinibacillus danicus]